MARLVAVHFWPVEKNDAFTTFSTADGKSASASTMVGFLPPISSWMRSERLRRLGMQPAAHFAGAGERDRLQRLGFHQRLANGPARACDEVHHAFRNAGLVASLHNPPGAQRRDRGGLHHDRVAADQRRRHLPGRNRDGKIPGRHQPDHADRPCGWRTCARGRARTEPADPAAANLPRRNSGRC